MLPGLELAGHLTILADERDRIDVQFRGDVVAVVLPDLRGLRALRRKLPRPGRVWRERLRSDLSRAGLELQVWIGSRQVGRLAADTRAGRLARWLGLDPIELRIRSILAVLAGR
jgi:hypothetical protein